MLALFRVYNGCLCWALVSKRDSYSISLVLIFFVWLYFILFLINLEGVVYTLSAFDIQIYSYNESQRDALFLRFIW